jgi:hypothetical protein
MSSMKQSGEQERPPTDTAPSTGTTEMGQLAKEYCDLRRPKPAYLHWPLLHGRWRLLSSVAIRFRLVRADRSALWCRLPDPGRSHADRPAGPGSPVHPYRHCSRSTSLAHSRAHETDVAQRGKDDRLGSRPAHRSQIAPVLSPRPIAVPLCRGAFKLPCVCRAIGPEPQPFVPAGAQGPGCPTRISLMVGA